MQQIMSAHKMKAKNAYILIYERAQFIDQARFNELSDERSEAETCLLYTSDAADE